MIRLGAAVAATLTTATILLAGCTALDTRAAPSPTPTGVPEVDVLDLRVGDCLDTHGKPGITATVPVVTCDLEHDSEAYSTITLDGEIYPGDDTVRSTAEQGCTSAFVEFAGINYEESTLDYAYYFPTQGSWAEGDRRILCLILDPDARVTGTLEGAAR